MSGARGKIRRARVVLSGTTVLAALFWALVAWFVIRLLVGLVQWNVELNANVASVLAHVPWIAAIAIAAAMLWRGRFAWSKERAALWIEERAPELRYALVTLADPACDLVPTIRARLESLVERTDIRAFLRRAAVRSLAPALAALIVSGAVFGALPTQWRSGVRVSERLADASSIGERGLEMPSRIARVAVEVTPPRYTRLPAQSLENPLKISGVAGTHVLVKGDGSAQGIEARLSEKAVAVAGVALSWQAEFAFPDKAAALTLVDRQYKRVIVIDPQPDLPPDVRLVRPETDATLRKPEGSLAIEAHITDDHGIARARIEYIVSSGEGEGNIASRTGALGARLFDRDKSGLISMTVPLSFFTLQQGDILSVSVVAYDANDVTGPGKGRSETRNIRIARQSEYDALAVTPAPPAFDKTAMSLRMLIVATQMLVKQQPKLSRRAFVDRSIKLGQQGESIRQKLQTIIDEQGADAGVAAFAADAKLQEAMNNMWDGVRALNVAEPLEALPPLRRAYHILKVLSDTAKYYLRGTAPPVIVNIDRVRLTGKENVAASRRKPREETDAVRKNLMRDYARAVEMLRTDRDRALELFLAMQVTALRESAASAEALGKVVAAIDAGKDVTAALLEARHAIEGPARAVNRLPVWSNSW